MKNQKKITKPDGSSIFLIIFGVMFVAMIARTLLMGGGAPTGARTLMNAPRPVELSFSDVLRREKDIQTMDIRGNNAKGTLRDGTPYRATIAYDPDLLERFSAAGAAVSIDDSKTWVDYLGMWVPILMGLLFIWWLFRGMRGGAGGMSRALVNPNPKKMTTGKTKTTF